MPRPEGVSNTHPQVWTCGAQGVGELREGDKRARETASLSKSAATSLFGVLKT